MISFRKTREIINIINFILALERYVTVRALSLVDGSNELSLEIKLQCNIKIFWGMNNDEVIIERREGEGLDS